MFYDLFFPSFFPLSGSGGKWEDEGRSIRGVVDITVRQGLEKGRREEGKERGDGGKRMERRSR